MMRVKGLGLVVLVSALMGCAVQKPTMTEQNYRAFAAQWVAVQHCSAKGWIDPNTGALGKRYLQAELSNWQVSQESLEYYHKETSQYVGSIHQEQCNQIAVAITEQAQQIEMNNQNVRRTEQQIQDAINTRPTNTYCNKIGTQVLCNSY